MILPKYYTVENWKLKIEKNALIKNIHWLFIFNYSFLIISDETTWNLYIWEHELLIKVLAKFWPFTGLKKKKKKKNERLYSRLVCFLCLIAYQPSWIIKCQSQPCRKTAVVVFNPLLEVGLGGLNLSEGY